MKSPSKCPPTTRGELAAIVGDAHAREALPADAVDGVEPDVVVEPGSADEVARVLALAGALGLRVAPCGGGTKRSWGNRLGGLELVLSTRRLARVLEHAWGDMTATVEAGCTIAALQGTLGLRGQRLALDPLWPEAATVGGVVATSDCGPLRVRYGPPRNVVLGVTAALANGTLARSGGKVVKNVAGYDLPKLMTGSFGTLAVITEVTFRVHPLPPATGDATYRTPGIDALGALLLRVADSTLAPARVQVRARGGTEPELDVCFEGPEVAVGAQLARLADLAGDARLAATPIGVWREIEALWTGPAHGLVAKVSLPPADIDAFVAKVDGAAASARLEWRFVGQADGAGLVRLEGPGVDTLSAALEQLRAYAVGRGGSLVVLDCPAALKARVDVWGPPGDALPLMRRVKERFDPRAILNPGRFVGGI
jgi:glycolate oxidase FAD binding subunit